MVNGNILSLTVICLRDDVSATRYIATQRNAAQRDATLTFISR